MDKKLITGFIVVYVVGMALSFITHEVLLKSFYDDTATLWRPEMKTWIFFVTGLFFAFFFTFIFSKGYEGRGIMEGVRYGFYMSLLINIPVAYNTYAAMEIPYGMALQWFLYGTISFIILGIILTFIYGGKPAPQKEA